jgi:hypothetical protein
MSDNLPATLPILHLDAFLRTLIAPLMMWGVTVLTITAAGQPGVVCMTPLAWLLALWCGGQYVRLSDGQPDRFGPISLGAALGLALGLVFVLVAAQAMPVEPSEVGKSLILDASMVVVGIVVCAALCAFTARATLRRYNNGQV